MYWVVCSSLLPVTWLSLCSAINLHLELSKRDYTTSIYPRKLAIKAHTTNRNRVKATAAFVHLTYRKFVSYWPVDFACGRLGTSHWYGNSDSWLADETKQMHCSWEPMYTVGPSASCCILFTGQKLTNIGNPFVSVWDCMHIFLVLCLGVVTYRHKVQGHYNLK
jgi:hypothetical protein